MCLPTYLPKEVKFHESYIRENFLHVLLIRHKQQ